MRLIGLKFIFHIGGICLEIVLAKGLSIIFLWRMGLLLEVKLMRFDGTSELSVEMLRKVSVSDKVLSQGIIYLPSIKHSLAWTLGVHNFSFRIFTLLHIKFVISIIDFWVFNLWWTGFWLPPLTVPWRFNSCNFSHPLNLNRFLLLLFNYDWLGHTSSSLDLPASIFL